MVLAQNLMGYLLVENRATLPEKTLSKEVAYICGFDHTGVMGILMTKQLDNVTFYDLIRPFSQEKKSKKEREESPPWERTETKGSPIYYGGPINPHRGFVLHSPDFLGSQSFFVTENMVISTTGDVLIEIEEGRLPKHFIALGHMEWSLEQLDEDLKKKHWVLLKGEEEMIFDPQNLWQMAWKKVERSFLSLV